MIHQIEACAITTLVVLDDAVPNGDIVGSINATAVTRRIAVLDDKAINEATCDGTKARLVAIVADNALAMASCKYGKRGVDATVIDVFRNHIAVKATIQLNVRTEFECLRRCAVACIGAFGHPNLLGGVGLIVVGCGQGGIDVIHGILPRRAILVARATHFHIPNLTDFEV